MNPAWSDYVSATDHKRRATTIRRLATGLRAEIAGQSSSGLTDKEVKILTDAESLLKSMANHRDVAKKKAELRVLAQNRRIEEITKLAAVGVAELVTIQDKVALLAGVKHDVLRYANTVEKLNGFIKEVSSDIAWGLLNQAGTPKEVVANFWEKYQSKRSSYLEAYSGFIVMLLDEKKQ